METDGIQILKVGAQFLTAVRIDTNSIKETLELMQFEEAKPWGTPKIVPMQGFLDNNWEVKLVGDFAIQQYNLKSNVDDKLELHQLFEYCKSSGKDYVSHHHLTLLTYNQNLDEARSMFRMDDFEWSHPLFRDDGFTANRLKAIADGLGVEQTREFCIRDLTQIRYNVNDHVLRRIAEALGEFIPMIS
ncbi:hypothetical protein FRX31_033176 [Thalictrum thalictroides]|uniref:Uncharacterized protein n=1 Tax=Thalictrum thalictroides TaxID=46969 RepID=A0A7J6UXB2_THATH|nr:hypothetical protein FRX31_033176 [Thalictrum thalictroides]